MEAETIFETLGFGNKFVTVDIFRSRLAGTCTLSTPGPCLAPFSFGQRPSHSRSSKWMFSQSELCLATCLPHLTFWGFKWVDHPTDWWQNKLQDLRSSGVLQRSLVVRCRHFGSIRLDPWRKDLYVRRNGKGWKEEVERDVQVVGVRRWTELVADRKKWKDIVRQAKAHSGL